MLTNCFIINTRNANEHLRSFCTDIYMNKGTDCRRDLGFLRQFSRGFKSSGI